MNGNWLKDAKIPDDETRWGGFGVLREKTRNDVLELVNIARASKTYPKGSDQQKAIFIFESQLDSTARDAAGISPLQPFLDKINSIKTLTDLQTVIATSIAVSAPFAEISSYANMNDSSMNIAWVFPSSLGMERDYYLDQDDKSIEIREKYVAHVARMLQFIDYEQAAATTAAETILALETTLTRPRLDKIALRDARNYNNPMDLAALDALMPDMDWKKHVADLGITKGLETLNVMQPEYMKALNTFLKTTPIEDLKLLMTWSTLNNAAGYLSSEIEMANWDFYYKTLNGAKAMRPAEERALETVEYAVGEAIGKVYVDAKFPPEAKEKAEKMIANVIKAFQIRINKLDWLSEVTKTKAIEKLDKFTVKIAYPDTWEDYSTLDIKEGNSFVENMLAISHWSLKKSIAEIGEPVDKSEWGMPPQMVNAYFNPTNNEIVFPAAILQPPFYNYTADDAENYGGIGAVIGHEISHAFDDSGARFDGDGKAIDGMDLAKKLFEEDLTPGQLMLKRLQDEIKGVPDFYRSDLQQEFHRIWEFQKTFYPKKLTDKLKSELFEKNKKVTYAICKEPFQLEGIKEPPREMHSNWKTTNGGLKD